VPLKLVSPYVPLDPYRSFKFRLRWEGNALAGFSRVSGLDFSVDVVDYRAGGAPPPPTKLSGRSLPQPVRLEMKYQRIPNLNASGTEVTIATLTLGNEGLETYPP
jgi:hypothetical protein